MVFWLSVGLLSLLVAAIVLGPLLRRPSHDPRPSAADYGVRVYRDQLTEVDRDLAKGVLNEDEADRTRLEISRRILEADKESSAPVPHRASRATTGVAVTVGVLLVVAGAFGIYQTLGARGAADFPLTKRLAAIEVSRDARLSQTEAEARVGTVTAEGATPEYIELVRKLRAATIDRPDDLQGQKLLAQHEARIGNFIGARQAQGQVVALLGDQVQGSDYVDLAELMIIAADGFVSPEAEQALSRALQMVPRDSRARYYAGLGLVQSGRPDIAYKLWAQLLAEGPEDAPWIAPITAQINSVARQAGLSASAIVSSAPGPSADQIKDAESLSVEDRDTMIRSMVSRLSDRLASEGGNADEWARLIRALGVLGETARASAVWNDAKITFASDAIALDLLLQAARTAEVAN